MIGKTINEIEIGDSEIFQKTISESDVYLFAGITGDFNPAHLNDQEAKKTIFKSRIAHGILTAGLISAVLGTKLPGPGTIYLDQYLSFKKPVYFGDTITAKVTVLEKNIDKNIIVCETLCNNQNDEIVLVGKATVMPPKVKGV
ncbi:MAG: MaoC family dehydratase [Bacillota bacterium]|nr:MaoC family dehydratase [Bacillota bacterium]